MSTIYRGLLALVAFPLLFLAACQPLHDEELAPLVLLPPSFTPRSLSRITPTPSPLAAVNHTLYGPTKDIAISLTRTAEARAWLTSAGLGPYASESETQREVESRAQAEGRVILYTDSAKALAAIESFMLAYPGLKAEAQASGSYDIYLRLINNLNEEHKVDLYLVSDPPRTLALQDQGHLVNYLPADLVNAFPQEMREPLLVHHWTALIWIGSPVLSRTYSIKSWWDLTLPQWRGRVALPDPIRDERTLYVLTSLTQRSEELAAAYQAQFGHDLVLDADCPNAGYQWIKDLLTNQPLLLPGDADVAYKVGDPQSTEAWVGLCSYERFAKVCLGELSFLPLLDLAPAAGFRWPTYLGIVNRCSHPQAAKLLARWLLGDVAGRGGYTPWNMPGIYPGRIDIPDPPGAFSRQEVESRLWPMDYAYINAHLQAVRDHVAAHIGRPVGGR